MNILRSEIDGVPVFAVDERLEIDLNHADAFKAALVDALEAGDRSVILDAERIDFFDSAGMGSLLSIQKTLKARGGSLHLVRLSRSVAEIFSMVGFDVIFPIHADVATAAVAAADDGGAGRDRDG